MPNETADALARMLSLSTEKQHATAAFSQQPVLSPLTRKNSRANVFEGDPWTFVHYPRDKSLETSLFHNAERALDEASPDYAPGPLQFEDAYADPYGSAAHQSPLGFWGSAWEHEHSPQSTEGGEDIQPEVGAVDQAHDESPCISLLAHELPRDCLLILLQSAVGAKQNHVVAQCMRALGPMSPQEYGQCMIAPNSSDVHKPSPAVKIQVEISESPATPTSSTSTSGSQTRWSPLHNSGPAYTETVCSTIAKPGARSGTVGAIRLSDSRAGMRTSVLTVEQAIEVFNFRPAQRCDRASLCSDLAQRYGVTTTAIRHIWDRRTWVWTTLPHWTKVEMAASLAEGTCDCCRRDKVDKIEDTCENCPINRKRGRPRGSRDTYSRKKKDPFENN